MARYIDADIVKQKISQHSSIQRVIDSIPTADVAPVRHGRWIEDGTGIIVCSECGEEHCWDEYRATYCDICGAKMDGQEGENE